VGGDYRADGSTTGGYPARPVAEPMASGPATGFRPHHRGAPGARSPGNGRHWDADRRRHGNAVTGRHGGHGTWGRRWQNPRDRVRKRTQGKNGPRTNCKRERDSVSPRLPLSPSPYLLGAAYLREHLSGLLGEESSEDFIRSHGLDAKLSLSTRRAYLTSTG
jgi:hypothetical protein